MNLGERISIRLLVSGLLSGYKYSVPSSCLTSSPMNKKSYHVTIFLIKKLKKMMYTCHILIG